MVDEEGTAVDIFFRGCIEEHNVVLVDGDDCMEADIMSEEVCCL